MGKRQQLLENQIAENPGQPDQKLLTVDELAARLKMSASGVYKLVHRGVLKPLRIGGKLLRFRWSEVIGQLSQERRKIYDP